MKRRGASVGQRLKRDGGIGRGKDPQVKLGGFGIHAYIHVMTWLGCWMISDFELLQGVV